MSDCVYEFTGADGQPMKIVGMAAMKAYMAQTGMGMDGVTVTDAPTEQAPAGMSIRDALELAIEEEFGPAESKPELRAELRRRLSALADRAQDAGDGALAGRMRGFTVGMSETDPNLTREWVDEVVSGYTKTVEKLERKNAPNVVKAKSAPKKTSKKSAGENLMKAAQDSGKLVMVSVGDKKAGATKANEKTAGDAAKSAAKNTGMALADVAKGLLALFGSKPGQLNSGIGFSQETYEQAKPLFLSGIAHFKEAASDVVAMSRALVRALRQEFGFGKDDVTRMLPYLERFIEEVQNGSITGEGNESQVQGAGPETLGTVAAEEGGGAEGQGSAGPGPADGSGTSDAPSGGADGAGVSGARGRGSRASGVRASGARGKSQRPGSDRAGETGAGAPQTDPQGAGDSGRSGPVEPPNIPAVNYRITSDTRLGKGGEVEKFNDNIAAIQTLKRLEAENRRATPEEQRILARYVGWGGLDNAFPSHETGEFKDGWRKRGELLRSLLTKKEYDKARNSTIAAHYTSETVVSAMWQAAKRLGFKGGLALENSMGTGNFLGLMPDGLNAKFIGIEYDHITAGIASALYPQATVLNAGFEKIPLPDNAFMLNIGNPPFNKNSLTFQFKPELSGVSMHNQFFRAGMDALRPGGLQIKVVSRYLLDAQDKTSRLALAEKARLIAAFRLPDMAFQENARTSVVTDIIILQKLDEAEQAKMREAIDAYRQRPGRPGTKEETERAEMAAMVPSWVDTTTVADPLGGEPIVVNKYLAQNPQNIMGRLERSGSMQHKNDITVRLDNPEALASMLADAVARLPEGIQNFSDEVIAKTEERFKSMSDALRIAIAQEEIGHLKFDKDGKLQRVIERETPEGGVELGRQEITPQSPWSDTLSQDADGKWFRQVVVTDAEGNPVKLMKDGKATKRNIYTREVFENEADIPDSLRLGETDFARLKGIVELRDLLKAQIVLETEDAEAEAMQANRTKLAAAYEAYVAKHGPVSRATSLRLAMTMPDGGLVAALEVGYQPARTAAQAKKSGLPVQEEKATPAPILRERVVPKYEPATSADTAADALAIVLSESGRVNIERIAELRGITKEEAISELQAGDSPLVFLDPESQTWETADVYLSGMVKRKLKAAEAAGMAVNIKALQAVQPEDWTAENVTVSFGSSWVPADVYASFIEHLIGGSAKVRYAPLTNSFSADAQAYDLNKFNEWSTQGADVLYIINRALNSKSVTVTDKDADGNTVVLRDQTDLANLKAKEIRAEFADWIFVDEARRERLVGIANETFNTRVTRQHNGQHLKLPGKVPDTIIKMRRHQLNAIWRGIYERFMLVDHAVGAGKTFTAIARAMERRRMGLSKKPMIVVPNHLVEQWAADVYRLYPGAKVLAAGKKDFEVKNRRRLLGKIATGDWDIVIMPHSSFGGVGIAPETERRYLEKELELAIQAVKDAEEQAKEDGLGNGFRKPFSVKQAEALVTKIEGRLGAINSGVRDRMLTFEQLGVDDLTIDESHEFKNLYYSSNLTGVRGMGDRGGSRKANDLYNKVRILRESPTGSVTFMTGTPISNSAVEMYTIMRFLAADSLKEMGLENFDAWRTEFVEHTTKFEPTETGSIKEVSRLGRTWSNMRALMELYYQFTDAVSLEDIQRWYAEDNGGREFPAPKVAGGSRQLVKIKPTEAQTEWLNQIIAGFDALPNIDDPYERNAERLRLMDRARKVSVDVRSVDPRNASKEEGGKLDVASQNIKRLYDKYDDVKGTQLVFLDRSVPKAKGDDKVIKEYDALIAKRDQALQDGDTETFEEIAEKLEKYNANEIEELRLAQAGGWNAYQQIKDNLIAAGIPEHEIRFVQEATTDEQKLALFDAVRGGKVRVLIGSTPRMGAGTNVQDRLVALHHVDVTWKPSDIEQREGRIIRQGNIFATPPDSSRPNPHYRPDFEVEILAYATERTVDAKMWDLNATKLRTINGIRKYDGSFTMDFEDEDAVGMAEMAAIASGNPLLLERIKVESEISVLELLERSHRRKMFGAQDAERRAKDAIENHPARIEREKKRVAEAQDRVKAFEKRYNARTVTVEGKEFDSLGKASQHAFDVIKEQQAGDDKAKFAITVNGKRYTGKEPALDAIAAALGDVQPFEMDIDGRFTGQRTTAGRDVAAMLNVAGSEMTGQASREVELGTVLGMRLVAGLQRDVIDGNGFIDADIAVLDKDGRTMVVETLERKQAGIQYNTTAVKNALDRVFGAMLSQASDTQLRRLERQLDDAKANYDGLKEKANQPFPKAAELKAKRDRLVELVGLLDGSAPVQVPPVDQADLDAADKAAANLPAALPNDGARWWYPVAQKYMQPAVFRQASPAAESATGVTLDTVNQIAEKVLAGLGMAGQVNVEAFSTPADAGIVVPPSVVPSGGVNRGRLYVFAKNLADELDAFKVVFHELFHLGLSQSVMPEAYTQTMLRFMRDPLVLKYAKRWKMSGDGQSRKQTMATNAWHALAVEEALADIAEEINTGDKIGTKDQAAWVKRTIATLANFAERVGLGKIAAKLRAMTYTDAEAFVMETMLKAKSGAKVYLSDERYSDASPAAGSDAFARWFGDSKVVDSEGAPLVVYHGTGADFSTFDQSRIGDNYQWSKGFYFAGSPDAAAQYAMAHTDAMPAQPGIPGVVAGTPADAGKGGANVMPVYLAIKNPMVRTARGNMSPDQSADRNIEKWVAEARERGNDGLIVNPGASFKDRGPVYIAFRPEQIKSAIGNNGDFDPTNPDIRFRSGRRPAAGGNASGGSAPTGRNADRAIKASVVTRIKDLAGYKATDLLGISLQALGRRQLVDIYGDMLPLKQYDALTAQMEADKNDGAAEADDMVRKWAKLKDEKELADLMHDATLSRLDPSKPLPWRATVAEREIHAELKSRFDALTPGAQEMYREARNAYQRHHFNVRRAITERIMRSELSEDARETLLKRMDAQFFKALKGVYFPLARFGQYVVAIRGMDGKITSVSRAETMAEAQELRRNLIAEYPESEGYTVGEVTRDKDFRASHDMVGRGFMKDLFQALDKQDLSPDQRAELDDTLGQLYLSSLPDLSWAKHGIHRKGTPGFSQDARRAFAQNMFHGARYLAKLKYGDLMLDQLNAMQEAVDDMGKSGDKNQPRAQQVVDEFFKRHDSMMNPASNPLSTALTSLGFVWHLGLSPASALVNLSQTAFVAYPVMGAKWGFDKAGAALLKASKQALVGRNDITGSLSPDELAAYDNAVRSGTIDVTQAHDLAGIAQGEDDKLSWKVRPWMRAASFMFHHAERFNRQVTFIAAYRLAREAGADHNAAQEQATQATYDGHFDYSSANRPRVMQGNVAKVVLLFKQYAQNMLYTILRNTYVGFIKSATSQGQKDAAKQARRTVYGLAAMTQFAAGAMGMPWLVTAIPFAIANAIGGDDDEPWDAETALQNYLTDTIGPKFADVFMHGASRLGPWDISGRVGLDKLIFPDVQEGLTASSWVEKFGFAMAGAVPGIFLNIGRGLEDVANGHYVMGLENMMPTVLRNAIKAFRYETEGAQDRTGITILDDVNAVGVAGQALGFSPSKVRLATEAKGAIRAADTRLKERRERLMTKFARASMEGDTETMQEVRKEISRFNSKNGKLKITFANLQASVKARRHRISEAQQGVYLPKNRRGVMSEGRFGLEGGGSDEEN